MPPHTSCTEEDDAAVAGRRREARGLREVPAPDLLHHHRRIAAGGGGGVVVGRRRCRRGLATAGRDEGDVVRKE